MNSRIFDWPLVNESSGIKIKQIVSKIWTTCADFIFFNARDCGSDLKGYPIFYFATIHLREVSQICNGSFKIGQPPISVTGHWRILSFSQTYGFFDLSLDSSSLSGHSQLQHNSHYKVFSFCFVFNNFMPKSHLLIDFFLVAVTAFAHI